MSTTSAETLMGEIPPSLRRRRWLVRWTAHGAQWKEGFEPNGGSTGDVEVVVAVEVVDARCAIVEGWLQHPGRRHALVPRQTAPCTAGYSNRLLHIDVLLNGERALAISIEPETERLLYARSVLPAQAGLAAGAFDPPRMTVESVAEEAASA